MARAFDLRPLQFGDHLSRSFSMFAQHWLALARWFMLTWFIPMAGVTVLLHTLLDPYAYLTARTVEEPSTFAASGSMAYAWLIGLIAIALSQWFSAAGVLYMGARYYVGASPGFMETARAVFKRSGWLTGLGIVHLLAIGGIGLVAIGPAFLLGQGRGSGAQIGAWMYAIFVGTPALFLILALYLGRYGLAPCCIMLDDADSTSAFARSQALSKGFRWRLYMLMVVAAILTGVPGLWSMLDLAGLLGRELLFQSGVPLAGDLLRLLWQGLLAPLFFLPLVVFYFDQRSRKEGYDIAVMARNFGIDEVQLLHHQANAHLGYIPKGWKGGRLHPKPQAAPLYGAPVQAGWPAQQWAPPRPSAVVYRPPVRRGGPL